MVPERPTPKLPRSMKMLGNMLITVSVITPASSIFIIAPGVLHQAGSGALLCFGIAALVCLFTALVYAELSSAFPFTGGEYAIIGRVLGPLAGFIALTLNLVTLVLMTSVIALGIGSYTGLIFPGASPFIVGVGSIVITTFLSLLNIRTNAFITGSFLVIEIIALVVLATLGFAHIERPLTEIIFHPVTLDIAGASVPTSLSLIGLATSVAIFSYNGYGSAVYFGEETRDARHQIARAILWSVAIGIILEAVPVAAMLLGTPSLSALLQSNNMVSDFILSRTGGALSDMMSLGVALAILNANIASVLLVARLLFSSGRDKVWTPVLNSTLTKLHPKSHSPVFATLAAGALASAACFIDINILLVLTGTGLVVTYMTLCLSAIIGRRKGLSGRKDLYRMPFFPLPPLIALAVLIYVMYADALDLDIGRPSLFATAALIALAVLYYFTVLRRKGDWVLVGPDEK